MSTRFNRQRRKWLLFACVFAAGGYLLYEYTLWKRGHSDTSKLNEIAYCLGFFDGTRAIRIRYKVGDGADELTYMHSLASSYARLLKTREVDLKLGPSVNSGRTDAQGLLLGAVVAWFDDNRVDIGRWAKVGDKCRDAASKAVHLAEAAPRSAVSPAAPGATSRSIEEAAKLCVCDGALRSGARAGIAEASLALNRLSPAVARLRKEYELQQHEAATKGTPAMKQAHEKRLRECEYGRSEAEVALSQFPPDFLAQTRLLEGCYALARAPQQ